MIKGVTHAHLEPMGIIQNLFCRFVEQDSSSFLSPEEQAVMCWAKCGFP